MKLVKVALVALFLLGSTAFAATAAPIPLIFGEYGESVLIIGGFSAQKGWMTAGEVWPFAYPGTKFQVYSPTKHLGEITTDRAREDGPPMGIYARVRDKLQTSEAALVTTQKGHLTPRVPRSQSLHSSIYRDVAASLLRQRGLNVKPVQLTQNLRIDLNGDGVEEVLLAANSRDISDPFAKGIFGFRGEYSLTALRYLDKKTGKVRTVPLEVDIHTKKQVDPSRGDDLLMIYEIFGCIDLNGDGRMEIIVASRYYEGWGYSIFEFDGKTVKRVITNGWGV